MITRTRRTALVLGAASTAAALAALSAGPASAEPTLAPAPAAASTSPSGTEPMCGEAAAGTFSCSLWTEHGTVTVIAASSCPPVRQEQSQARSWVDLHDWARDVVDCSTTAREAVVLAATPLGIVNNGLGK